MRHERLLHLVKLAPVAAISLLRHLMIGIVPLRLLKAQMRHKTLIDSILILIRILVHHTYWHPLHVHHLIRWSHVLRRHLMLIVLSTLGCLFELFVILWRHLLVLHLIRVHEGVLGTTMGLLELAELIIGIISLLSSCYLVIIVSFLRLFAFNVHLYRFLDLVWRWERSVLLGCVIFHHFLLFE